MKTCFHFTSIAMLSNFIHLLIYDKSSCLHFYRCVWPDVPIFLCAWHVLKKWCILGQEKMYFDNNVQEAILFELNNVIYMPIMYGESVEDLICRGKERVTRIFQFYSNAQVFAQYFWRFYDLFSMYILSSFVSCF